MPGGPGERNGAETAGADATATDATSRTATNPAAGATDAAGVPANPATGTATGTAAGTATGTEAGGDEHAELERLRAEVRDLRARQDAEPRPVAAGRGKGHGRWHSWVAAIAITLGCVLAPVSVLGVWAANQVSNTDRFVANMAPLITEPPIQHALSNAITTNITSRLDVQALTRQTATQLSQAHLPRLSTLVTNFAGPIASGINGFIGTAVARIVASPAVATVWVTALRTAHAGVVRVLSGQGGGSVDVQNGKVVLSLGPLINDVKQQLVARGLTIVNNLPSVNTTFPLFEAPNLAKAQQGYRLITTLRWVLPLLSLALLAVGIWAARSRRRGLFGAALGLSASMLVLAIALTIARSIYLNSVPQSVLPSDAAGALYDTLVRFIREGLRVLLVVGLVIAAGAFLTGPSAAAVGVRRGVVSGIDWLRTRSERAGLRTGPVGTWTGAHKTVLRVGAVALVALIFAFWGQPSLAVVIWLVVVLLVLLGLIELVGGRTQAAPRAGPPGPGQPAAPRTAVPTQTAPPH